MRTSAFVFCLLILLSRTLSAGVTGKLSGVIRDAGTEEPLVGANVILVGTALGAATDASGFYFVNNVPPGVYSVRVTLIGYRPLLLNDVRIMVDVTTELDGALTDEAVELGVVEITAERSIVQKDLTSTRTIVDGDIIVKDLRFQDINEVLQLQAGVVRGTDGQLHVRGGRAGGTLYQVDGIPLQNPFDRSQAGEVEVERVQELQTLLGTFDAEYGNASDGVVTVYTKDGGEKYAGRVFYQSPRLNSSPYQVPDWNLDRPEVQALPPDQQQEYLDEVRKPDGSSAYEYANVLDDPYAQDYLLINALGTWTANLSGPVPFLSPLTFFITGRLVQENGYLPFGYNILQSATAKLTYPLSSVLTLRGSGDWAAGYRQFYNHQYKYWRWWDSGLDTLGREGGFPINENHNNRQLLSIRHVLSQSTFYDLSLARVYENSSQVVPDRTVVSDPATGELIASDYEQRQWVGGNDSGFRYGDVRYWVNTKTTQYIVKGNIESQVHPSHQLRAGVEVNFNEIFRHRIGMPTRPNLEYFTYNPIGGAVYLQDKIEYSFMILKVGVRLDMFDPRASAYPDPSNILYTYTTPSGSAEYETQERIPVEREFQVSPRVGIAHPISDRTSIHFAYGHFFQTPRFYDLYRNDGLSDILANDALVGNPGLKPEKTVSFELGLQQELSLDWALNVTAYSKDITNLTSSFYYFVGRDYTIFINADYARIQGIDVTLDKRFSNLFGLRLIYSLMNAQGNHSDPTEGFSYREEDANLRPNRNYPLDFDQRHKVSLTFISRTPKDFGPKLLGFYPFEFFSLSGIFLAGSGLPYTPTSRAAEETGVVPEPNSARRPWTFNLDLKLSREIPMGPVRLTAFLDVDNLFDNINTVFVWTRTGEAWNEGPTSVRTKDRQGNPENVGLRRSIRVGAFLEF